MCIEAKEYSFASVCINPGYVSLCSELLRGTNVRVCTVVGFPLGSTTTEVKRFETEQAISNGATEIDMVLNVGRLKQGDYEYVIKDVSEVVNVAKKNNVICKVIIETALLNDEEKVKACLICKNAGADFVKTSTGFSKGGATVADVALMKYVVGRDIGVKASGGIKSKEDAEAMIASGADRIGASASVKIVTVNKIITILILQLNKFPKMILDIIVIKTNDGYTAEIPSLVGCESWAHDEDTVLKKILELASFYLNVNSGKFKLDKARRTKNISTYKLVFNKGDN